MAGYDQHRYDIELTYASLGDGETHGGEVCPACQGGDTSEKSLSVSRRGNLLLWNCHRASCSFHGARYVSSAGGRTYTPSHALRSSDYIQTTPLSEQSTKQLAEKFGITGESASLAELAWTGPTAGFYGRRVCFPIFGPNLKKRGENYRSYENAEPKTIIRMRDSEQIVQCWYKWQRVSPYLFLVEDQMSAIRLAQKYHSVSLMGTNLSDSKVEEIRQQEDMYEQIYLCLDNDATYKAIKLALKWRQALPNLQVRGLATDIKDMPNEEFDTFMSRFK